MTDSLNGLSHNRPVPVKLPCETTADDHAMLSRLVAGYRSTDKEAQATAGIYMELIGNTTVADEYFEKAGPEIREQLEELFE